MQEENARPSYYDFIRALDNQRNEYGMTSSEQLLYHTLLVINNRKHWVDWFHCTDVYLTDYMSIGVTAMKNARNKLKQNGMIDFIPSKRRGESTQYCICNEFCTYSINVQTNNKQSTNVVQTTYKPHANKDIRYKIKDNIPPITPQDKIKYAEFVSMTNAEYKALIDSYGEADTKSMIEILDNYKGSKGKKYKSDYRAIKSWVVNALEEEKQKTGRTGTVYNDNDLDYDELEKIMQGKM